MSLKEIWADGMSRYGEKWAMILENGTTAWTQEDPRVLLAVFAGLLAAVLWCVALRRKILRRQQQKEAAIRAGHVINAKRVSFIRDVNEDESGYSRTVYRAKYEYTAEGQTKHYSVHKKNSLPPAFICLYYTDSPQKVFSAYDNLRVWYPLFIPAGILVCLLTMYLTGYFS